MTTELLPEFAMSIRGYDRIQVDDYVAAMREWLDTVTARLQDAEGETEQLREHSVRLRQRIAELESEANQIQPRSLLALGDRVARLLALAEESAQAVAADAEAAATDVVAAARTEAEEMTQMALTHQSEVEAWIDQATRQTTLIVSQAEQQATAVAARVTSQAEDRARELLEQARTEAAAIAEAARAERARALEELAKRRDELNGQIRDLEAQRDAVLTNISDLRESLHRTIGQLPQRPAPPPPPAPAPEAAVAAAAEPEPEPEPAGVDLRSPAEEAERGRREPVVFDQAEHESSDSSYGPNGSQRL
jgi:cell division septum initiation protein DivIVA